MAKRALLLARTGAEHQASAMHNFAAGLKRHGWATTIDPDYRTGFDLVVMWGVRRREAILDQKAKGGEVCVLERGYVGDRLAWTSVSFGGGLNGRAEFRTLVDSGGARWEKHFSGLMQPWRLRPNGYALICGQVEGDASLQHVDINHWYLRMTEALQADGIKVRFRPHPHGVPRQRLLPTLAKDLEGALVAVTFNSNSGVDAVLAGVPTIAMDEGSMAWPVTGHTLAPPPTPDRTAWAHRLAWCQWTKEEMAAGACWDAVGREQVAA